MNHGFAQKRAFGPVGPLSTLEIAVKSEAKLLKREMHPIDRCSIDNFFYIRLHEPL
jgi:hypothetical protein